MTPEELRDKAQRYVNTFKLTESGMLLAVQMFEAGYSARESEDRWSKVTRIEVVEIGVDRYYVDYNVTDVKESLQDEGRTLKIFVKTPTSTNR